MLTTEGYQSIVQDVDGFRLTVDSYKIGNRYHCHVNNTDPGATIARSEGATREEAEAAAIDKAKARLRRQAGA